MFHPFAPDEVDMTIYPTHSCFDDAMEFIEELAKQRNPIVHQMHVVHGICLHPDDNHRYSHAWVEEAEKFVIFAGIHKGVKQYFAAPRDEYHADARVQEFTKYTALEAAQANRRTGSLGPWEQKYLRLTRQGLEREGNRGINRLKGLQRHKA